MTQQHQLDTLLDALPPHERARFERNFAALRQATMPESAPDNHTGDLALVQALIQQAKDDQRQLHHAQHAYTWSRRVFISALGVLVVAVLVQQVWLVLLALLLVSSAAWLVWHYHKRRTQWRDALRID